MNDFKPCQGKTACRDGNKHCLTCGRDYEEITWLRDLLGQLSDIAITYDYENIDEYSSYIKKKLEKMIDHRRKELKYESDHSIV